MASGAGREGSRRSRHFCHRDSSSLTESALWMIIVVVTIVSFSPYAFNAALWEGGDVSRVTEELSIARLRWAPRLLLWYSSDAVTLILQKCRIGPCGQ